MSWLLPYYDTYSNFGNDASYSSSVKKSNIFFNQILLLMIAVTVSFIFIFYFFKLHIPTLSVSLLFVLYVISSFANRFQFHFLARLAVIWSTYSILIFLTYMYGKACTFHYGLIYMTALPLFIFHVNQRKYVFVHMTISALLFLLIESSLFFPTAYIALPPTVSLSIGMAMSIGTLFCLLGSLFMYFNLYRHTELSLQESLEEKQLLLKEIHHRVKNNLQVVSALLELQSLRTTNPHIMTSFKEMLTRIQSMALIHHSLYNLSSFSTIQISEYLTRLGETLQSCYSKNDQTISFSIPSSELKLSIDQAMPCGLIINELVTNAFKYAFKDQSEGELSIEITDTDDTAHLTVRDNGVGLPDDFDAIRNKSLGMQIVDDLVYQLNGAFRFESEQDKGTQFFITFPIERTAHFD